MASVVEDFLSSPSEELLEQCTKDQLLKIAEHFQIEVLDKKLKDTIKKTVKSKLLDDGVLLIEEVTQKPVVSKGILTFEQQKELLLLQLEHERLKNDRQLEMEVLRQKTEMHKLEVQQYRLELIREGKLASEGLVQRKGEYEFDVGTNLRLVPHFTEADPDLFFSLFERVAESRRWLDAERTLLLQCVFTGKAQEAYAALSQDDCIKYEKVKAAVLRAFELVPEAYRQRFRNFRRQEAMTHVEFVRGLATQLHRWCMSAGVNTFGELCNLVILEQLKNCVPSGIATFINERSPRTPHEAAVLADEYILTHKTTFSDIVPGDTGYRSCPIVRGNGGGLGSDASHYERQPWKNSVSSRTCNYCQRVGHWKNECPVLKSRTRPNHGSVTSSALAAPVCKTVSVLPETEQLPVMSAKSDYSAFISKGFVSLPGSDEKVAVTILRDTGALDSFVCESVLHFSANTDTGQVVVVRGMGLIPLVAPLHKINLHCGLVSGDVEIALRPELPVEGVDIILGNDLAGSRVWPDDAVDGMSEQTQILSSSQLSGVEQGGFPACAVTRAMSKAGPDISQNMEAEDLPPALCVPAPLQSISYGELVKEQALDPSLKGLFGQVSPVEELRNAALGYFVQNDVLVRKWVPHCDDYVGKPVVQIVVPQPFRQMVLKVAHDDVAGHMGVRKTYARLLQHFFWPRLKRDVSAYVKTCHTCQLTSKPNQNIPPAPLCPIPVISHPMEYLIVDCVGPLPPSKSGCQYLLTVMCQATRYPAAYPLRSITAKAVIKALTQFMSVFGIPKVLQSDRGSNFTSKVFSQALKLLCIRHNMSSAYHPESQGALERFHQTLKSLLRSFCVEMSRDWEEGLPWLLLAAREVVQDSTGFSPNDLIFGHTVRGPLTVLKSECQSSEPPQSLLEYVNCFRHRLYVACRLAKENLGNAQKKMKTTFDRRAELRQFSTGDQVLALLPVVGSPFQARFSGPFTVVRQVTERDYLISMPKRKTRLCHVNLLKPYFGREPLPLETVRPESGVNPVLCVGMVSGEVPSDVGRAGGELSPDDCVLQGRLKNSVALRSLTSLFKHLDECKQGELSALINNYPELFSDTPSCTDLIEHDIDVGTAEPIKQRFYRPDKREHLDREVQYMLENNIAEPSNSSWASPCLLVTKPDSTFRPCTDFRKVNNVTKPDVFPLPRMEDCVDQVGAAKYVSTFDLLKGYWQVPLSPRAQEISAFITPSGLYSYKVMPFGLRNAPATFQRLMNRVVSGLVGCAVYLDDVVIFSATWEDHLQRIRALLDRLLWAKLTVNLAKCEFAKAKVTYLGKVVGQGEVRPVQAKVEAIQQFPVPNTKKELMRFLGLAGYYRGFCRNFSTIVAPLTDLLKAKVKFLWSPECQSAFESVKTLLCASPVLAAPQFDKPFKLHVDASNVGAGAVLLQDRSGVDRPVSFFSRKFHSYQRHYSVIEKEALALIWALQHFEVYVNTGNPITIYTDHNPLTFLQSLQNPNQRLMRWALFLQPYTLNICHIRGVDNVMADALSRGF